MNYRRIKMTFLGKAKNYAFHGLTAFLTLISLLATVLGILQFSGGTCNAMTLVEIVCVIILVSLLWALIKGRSSHLPDVIVIDDDHDGRYELNYESKEICRKFNQETSKYFGSECVDDLLVESWRAKAPEAFIYLKNQHDEPCAALCIFGLRHSFMEQFIKGRVCECDIEEEDILDLDASKKSDSLYLAVIIVDEPHAPIGHRRALVMVWALIKYLKKTYRLRKNRTIFAVPINKASENLLKRLGFRVRAEASVRKDRHPLYCLDLNAQNVANALARIGDYSACCLVKT